MHPSQQQPSQSHGYLAQNSNTPDSQSYNSVAPSPHAHFSRSLSFSSPHGYQQLSPQYVVTDVQQQHYSQQSMYNQDYPQQYISNVPGQLSHPPPFPTPHRSSSDGMTYPLHQNDMPHQSNHRRTSLALQPGAARTRTVSLSYHRGVESTGASPGAYNLQPYPRDPRHSGPLHPPTAYRGAAASPTLQHQPSPLHTSHTAPNRLDTGLAYQSDHNTRRSSVSSQSSNPHREMPVLSTPQPYQQSGSSSPSSSGNQPRPHVCDSCGLAFVRGHDLKRHKDTHSNAKPHVCDCGKSFSRKDALKRHVFLKSCRGDKTASGYATSED